MSVLATASRLTIALPLVVARFAWIGGFGPLFPLWLA
jgi:hypothetical protein